MYLVTELVFAACGVVGVLLWVTGRRDALGLTSTGALFDRVLADRAARMVILLFWWWIGWHFLFARTVDPHP
ncbi:hypothetical protein GCM10009840_31100 [Pseudolysinimonas kribbensis]|jgi:hypothetical protein|uniref:Uncharacterized protein n=1 Tax=Pseudolysinimonas kribbensis TaxID=433641 RepID=A0ABQ6K5X4_9MICO|nr:DUF6186 family protein [Pseudolysinimonas kribbensis]GMA96028.1 hypothetical protein GCM10025881_28520 [Pseudolysinimonas kribbensis]